MKKTAPINIMVSPEAKKNLKQKAEALGLTLTAYIEKVASEPVVFLDSNTKQLLSMLKFTTSST